MTRARLLFLLSLGLLLLTGYNILHPLLPLPGFWQGLACGAILGAALSYGRQLFRRNAGRTA